jgi:hypothetical protein
MSNRMACIVTGPHSLAQGAFIRRTADGMIVIDVGQGRLLKGKPANASEAPNLKTV